jgi:hypothetical protein
VEESEIRMSIPSLFSESTDPKQRRLTWRNSSYRDTARYRLCTCLRSGRRCATATGVLLRSSSSPYPSVYSAAGSAPRYQVPLNENENGMIKAWCSMIKAKESREKKKKKERWL